MKELQADKVRRLEINTQPICQELIRSRNSHFSRESTEGTVVVASAYAGSGRPADQPTGRSSERSLSKRALPEQANSSYILKQSPSTGIDRSILTPRQWILPANMSGSKMLVDLGTFLTECGPRATTVRIHLHVHHSLWHAKLSVSNLKHL